MSNIIPPLLCDSPPPLNEDDDDDFGDFTTAGDLSYPGEALSLPTTPQHTPTKDLKDTIPCQDDFFPPISSGKNDEIESNCEISEIKMCNGHSEIYDSNSCISKDVEKDHQDKRKCDTFEITSTIEASVIETKIENKDFSKHSAENNFNNSIDNFDGTDIQEQESCETKSFTSETDNSETNIINYHSDEINTLTDIKPKDEDDIEFEEFQNEHSKDISCEEIEHCSQNSENSEFEDSLQNLENIEVSPENLTISTTLVEQENLEEATKQLDLEFDANFEEFQTAIAYNDENNETSTLEISLQVCEMQECDDDFGDFDDYSKQMQPTNSENMILNSEETCAKATKIISDLFPTEQKHECDFEVVDFFSENSIFKDVKDIEFTNALTYQWSNSESQKMLLKSLNIDRRNILYGPAWNPSMPRFAANLSFAPLEPVKSELPAINPSPSVAFDQQPEVSSNGHFDWTGTEITNSSNSMPISRTLHLDLGQIVSSLDVAHSPICTNAQSPIDNDSWDMWLQSLSPADDEQLTANVKPITLEMCEESINVPFSIQPEAEIPHPLQSEFSIQQGDNDSVKSLKFADLPTELEPQKEIDDGYDEFTSYKSADDSYSTWSSTSMPLRETHISNPANLKTSQIQYKDESEIEEKNAQVIPECQTEQEDDFTAFQMSAPQPVFKPVETVPLTHVACMEPLKPTVLPTAPTRIEWPEPGITNDDISNLELSLVTLKSTPPADNNKSTSSPASSNPLVKPTIQLSPKENKVKSSLEQIPIEVSVPVSKKNVEEDDWTDFVSNQDIISNPLQNRQHNPIFMNDVQKVSELSSSLPQMQQFSVSKPPQLDLFHQISPNHSSTSSRVDNVLQPVRTAGPPLIDPLEQFNRIHQQLSHVNVKPMATQRGGHGSNESDDDWTDFVSSPAVANVSNGWSSRESFQPSASNHHRPNLDWNKPPQFTSWSTNITPNIITNPVHFDLLPNYGQPSSSSDIFKSRSGPGNQRKPVGAVSSNKSSIPSISAMPDLDFISPRTRTFPKK